MSEGVQRAWQLMGGRADIMMAHNHDEFAKKEGEGKETTEKLFNVQGAGEATNQSHRDKGSVCPFDERSDG